MNNLRQNDNDKCVSFTNVNRVSTHLIGNGKNAVHFSYRRQLEFLKGQSRAYIKLMFTSFPKQENGKQILKKKQYLPNIAYHYKLTKIHCKVRHTRVDLFQYL